ncbi:hypothetical protein ACHQM5_016245 [Ranunculus cassubicifolius]
MALTKQTALQSLFGMSPGVLPDKYLGAPIFSGRVKKIHLQPLVQKIRGRASGYAGKMLAFAGRSTLVESVLASIPIHNLSVYKWPETVNKQGERNLKNFFWAGTPDVGKAVTVGWNKCCKPRKEGGLGFRRLKEVNQALLMKLGWSILKKDNNLARFMKAKYFSRNGTVIRYHKKSSIWTGLKWAIEKILEDAVWDIGDGMSIDFWRDRWCCDAIKDRLQLTDDETKNFSTKLGELTENGSWVVGPEMLQVLQRAGIGIEELPTIRGEKDELIWPFATNGELTAKNTYERIREKHQQPWWTEIMWRKAIHPRLAFLAWRICWGRVLVDMVIKDLGVVKVSKCRLCNKDEESLCHLFRDCEFLKKGMDWLGSQFKVQVTCLQQGKIERFLVYRPHGCGGGNLENQK